jgi:L-serine dehydratase
MALAGAVAGCQAECGVASAMAAAAITQIRGGNIYQILNSSALALKNVLGLTCDPVAGLVEVPCVKRNPFMAVFAITASELAMANIKTVIPTDEIVDAMEQTGKLMSPLLKETSKGGLAKTLTAKSLRRNLLFK